MKFLTFPKFVSLAGTLPLTNQIISRGRQTNQDMLQHSSGKNFKTGDKRAIARFSLLLNDCKIAILILSSYSAYVS